MPYIVCVNRPGCLPERNPVAVATLDEAQHTAAEELAAMRSVAESGVEIRAFTPSERGEADDAITANGGTIGPEPAGGVIDVRHLRWEELRELLPPRDTPIIREIGDGGQPLIDAYNGERDV